MRRKVTSIDVTNGILFFLMIVYPLYNPNMISATLHRFMKISNNTRLNLVLIILFMVTMVIATVLNVQILKVLYKFTDLSLTGAQILCMYLIATIVTNGLALLIDVLTTEVVLRIIMSNGLFMLVFAIVVYLYPSNKGCTVREYFTISSFCIIDLMMKLVLVLPSLFI